MLYGDSNDRNVPALTLYHSVDNGHLIRGQNPAGTVFQVMNTGQITTIADISVGKTIYAGGHIFSNSNVYSRGVMLTCDKNVKENFSNVNTLQILDKLASMPIQSWNYKEDSPSVLHVGPTAQDFKTAFELNGDDNKYISSVDIQGIALAAIQGLNEKLKVENDELHKKLANLEARLSALEFKG
ncbi:tail fiber domain-containing protein [Bacillus cereus]|uniref:tail fiber domain-containing protein n=1 Tax=Bacillus cereus TaxID=1396 RepID=UPI003D652CB9